MSAIDDLMNGVQFEEVLRNILRQMVGVGTSNLFDYMDDIEIEQHLRKVQRTMVGDTTKIRFTDALINNMLPSDDPGLDLNEKPCLLQEDLTEANFFNSFEDDFDYSDIA